MTGDRGVVTGDEFVVEFIITKTTTMSTTIEMNENDILLGRGGNNNKHAGNIQLRTLAHTHRVAYGQATKKAKSAIARELVNYIKSLTPTGRFLRKNPASDNWEEAEESIAKEKVSQALRDAVSGKDTGAGADDVVKNKTSARLQYSSIPSSPSPSSAPTPPLPPVPAQTPPVTPAPAFMPGPVPLAIPVQSSNLSSETAAASAMASMAGGVAAADMAAAELLFRQMSANCNNNVQANNMLLINAMGNSGFSDEQVRSVLSDPAAVELLLSQRHAGTNMSGNFMHMNEMNDLEMTLRRSQMGVSQFQSNMQMAAQIDSSRPASEPNESTTMSNPRHKYYRQGSHHQMDTASIVENVMNRRQSMPGTYSDLRTSSTLQGNMSIPMTNYATLTEGAPYMNSMIRNAQASLNGLQDAQSVQNHLQNKFRSRSRRAPSQRNPFHFNERSSLGGMDTISNFSSNMSASEVDLSNFDWLKNNNDRQGGSDMICD